VKNSCNLVDHFIERHLREARDANLAIVCGDRLLTYRQVAVEVNRAGNGLLRLGVSKGARVMLVLPDGSEFVAGYFGAIKIGAVAVPTAPGLTSAVYARLIAESRAQVVILHSQFFEEIAPLLGCLPFLRHLVVVGEERAGSIPWESWLGESSGELAAAAVSHEDAAFWRWNTDAASGGAIHRHGDWVCCCRNYAADGFAVTANDIVLSSSKLFHVRGLGNALMSPFDAGASTILLPGEARPGAMLAEMERTRATMLFYTPTQYEAMLREAGRRNYDLSHIRLAVSVAEPLPDETFSRWQRRFGVRILDAVHMFATRRRPEWQHWRSGARALYGQQILGLQ